MVPPVLCVRLADLPFAVVDGDEALVVVLESRCIAFRHSGIQTVLMKARIADHNAILVKLPLPEVLESTVEREVWLLRRADWTALVQDGQCLFKSSL